MERKAPGCLSWFSCLLLAAILAACARAGEEPVAVALGPAQIEQRGVAVTVNGAGNDVVLQVKSGHDQEWPGLTLKAPGGRWDWAKFEYLAVDIKNTGATAATISVRVDNAGANGVQNCNTGKIALEAGQAGTLRVDFSRVAASGVPKEKLFGMRGYPAGVGSGSGPTIDPAQVTQVLVFVARPQTDHTFEVSHFRTGGTFTPPAVEAKNFFPFIDTFGQYIHKDWPGKVHSLDELRAHATEEVKDWEAHPGPANWDQWGGWADGPKLDATGFFHTAKHNGKWWLVDPDGKLFFSHGVTGVRPGNSTPVDERAAWFQDFPGDRPEFKAFFETQSRVVNGHYAGKQPRCFNFFNANLKRKYGDEWMPRFADAAHHRLRSWGLNTIANWSHPAVYSLHRTPYVVAIGFEGKPLQGSQGYWGQFRDVFDPSFKADLRARMEQEKGKSADAPWCLGYFVDNELGWGSDTSLAAAALRSPAEQTAKQVFIADLKAKYGDIAKLNDAWQTKHASWDALAQFRGAPDEKVTAAKADLQAFYRKTCEQYFQSVRDGVHEAAPHQLYLGCRFAGTNDIAATAATKFCDVVSYNLYRRDIANFKPASGADVPLIVGEFHFGALDRGMFHTGLVPTKDQNDRAGHYQNYVRGALKNPYFVGTHWFQFGDEPTIGRGLDGENYQIGFVDNTDTPYPETIAALRAVGADLYRVRSDAK